MSNPIRRILSLLLTLGLLSAAGFAKAGREMQVLDGAWTLQEDGATTAAISAAVPGYVQDSLVTAGRLPALYPGQNPKEAAWVAERDWRYAREFECSAEMLASEHRELVFQGLDTFAEIFLNGESLGRTDNMFREYRFEVGARVKPGKNRLEVLLHSPMQEARSRLAAFPYYNEQHRKRDANELRKFVRKAQYQFGWDWACPIVMVGIWQPVRLEGWSSVAVRDVHFAQIVLTEAEARLKAEAELEASEPGRVKVRVTSVDASGLAAEVELDLRRGLNRVEVPFAIAAPRRWWPNGLGEQALYRLRLEVVKGEAAVVAAEKRVGLRTVEFVHERDEHGKSYYFKVNGVPVFMKGANYVPIDAVIPSVTPERYRRMLGAAAAANMNMLRIWGGGIYEMDTFYDVCDELGLLVYHDFMFASAMPSAEPEFLENVRGEASYQLRRLRTHACLALWAGSNETESAWHEFWKGDYPPQVWADHNRVFDSFLPGLVREHSPATAYTRSSPSANTDEVVVNTAGWGDTHAWSVWFGKLDIEKAGTERLSRFISEYGFAGYPSWRSLRKYLGAGELDRRNPTWVFHDAYPGIQDIIDDFLKRYYAVPQSAEDYVYLSGLLQAEAMRQSVEVYRRNMPYCMGSLTWQLNDVWPVASWASIDYYGEWKPLHHALRDAYAPVLLSPVVEAGEVRVYGVSDRLAPVTGVLCVDWVATNGAVARLAELPATLPANASTVLWRMPEPELALRGRTTGALRLRLLDGGRVVARNVLYLERPKNFAFATAGVRLQRVDAGADQPVFEITATALARGVLLESGLHDGNFSDNGFDLFPDEPRRITFTPDAGAPKPAKDWVPTVRDLASLLKRP
ncbi:glycosyl hydrolase 2 galactose-binding domain-containing protein [Nibricoccus sp. IMCC34717]|uniref:beta-mannosidase n=1 Tax=Nibricoccus sp. IMCC34717 TaxID=3034021 RepID=UPI00384A4652